MKLKDKISATIEFERTDFTKNVIIGGFKVEWMSGDNGEKDVNGMLEEFTLLSGAGCGNPFLYFKFRGVQYTYDIRKLIPLLTVQIPKKK